MNSLVKVPQASSTSKLQVFYNISITGCVFSNINICGAIISNSEDLNISSGLLTTQSLTFKSQYYLMYSQFLDAARNQFSRRRFQLDYQQNKTYNNSGTLSISIKDNQFYGLNILKNIATEQDFTRFVPGIGRVQKLQMQDRGFIVDLYGNFTNGTLTISDNQMEQIVVYNKDVRVTPPNHCDSVFSVPEPQLQLFQQDTSKSTSMFQYSHLINLRNLSKSVVLISDNIIQNISLTGALIHFEDNFNERDSSLALIGNNFYMIHSYAVSNIVEIIRSNNQLQQYLPDVAFKQVSLTSQVINLALFGGGILIQDNYFDSIIGCQQVITSIVSISVNMQQSFGYTNSNGVFTTPLASDLLNAFSVNLVNWLDNHPTPPYFAKQVRYNNQLLTVNPFIANFSGNTYSLVAMGVAQFVGGILKRGSLHSFNNIMAVDFSGENYTDVMGFTLDFLNQTIQYIKGEQTQIVQVQTDFYKTYIYQEGVIISPVEYSMFLGYYSSCLIYVNQMSRLRILGQNIFQNIWLLDRINALLVPSPANYNTEINYYGLILFLQNFQGRLQIGGHSNQDNQYDDGLRTVFQNLIGCFNDQSFGQFENWQPLNWDINFQMAAMTYLNFGLGSVIFNLIDSNNYFTDITIRNTGFYNIYTTILASGVTMPQGYTMSPSIMSTLLFQSLNSTAVQNLFMTTVDISDMTFLQQNSFTGINQPNIFFLAAQNVYMFNITVNNIGTYSIYQSLYWTAFADYISSQSIGTDVTSVTLTTQSNNQVSSLLPVYVYYSYMGVPQSLFSYSFFNVPQFQDSLNQNTPVLSQLNVLNSSFGTINPNSGLPWFQFQLINQYTQYASNQINFNNVNFTNAFGFGYDMAVIFSEYSSSTGTSSFSFNNLYVYNNSANYGLYYVQNSIGVLYFTKSTFILNSGMSASLFYVANQNVESLLIGTSYIQSDTVAQSIVKPSILAEQSSVFLGASILTAINTIKIRVDGVVVVNSNYAMSGSFINLQQNSAAEIMNSDFSYISAAQGGAFSLNQGSNLQLVNVTVSNTSAITAGVIVVGQNSYIEMLNCTFTDNFALYQAVFLIQSGSYFIFQDVSFIRNVAVQQDSIGLLIQISKPSGFSNVTFALNQAYYLQSVGGRGLEINACSTQISFMSCKFIDNTAITSTANLQIISSTQILIYGCLFTNSKNHPENQNLQGNFIQIVTSSQVTVMSTTFSFGSCLDGGAIYVLGDSNATLHNSSFINNTAIFQGGAISAQQFNTVIIEKGCQFISNRALNSTGDAIYAYNSQQGIYISNSSFFSRQASNFIDIENINTALISGTSFKLIPHAASDDTKESGLIISSLKTLLLMNSSFINLQGSATLNCGGALTITESSFNKSPTNNITISGCHFENSTSVNGGAISLINQGGVTISNGTIFVGNLAKQAGGAIFFSCIDYGLDTSMCSLTLIDSVFNNNSALVQGGAISWNFYEPKMIRVSNNNNSALVYGNFISSVAQSLMQLNQSDDSMNDVQSGGSFSMQFALIDKYANILRIDNSSKLFLNTIQNGNQNYSSVIQSQTQVFCVNGTFNVSNIVFVGSPNSTQYIQVTTDGINPYIPSNMNVTSQSLNYSGSYSNKSAFNQSNSSSIVVSLGLRSCVAGEELIPSGQCQVCSPDTYLLVPPLQPELCLPCPSSNQAECLGGNLLFPMAGYWRSSITSDNLIPCRNSDACIGRNGSMDNVLGACSQGYSGILCAQCIQGYSTSGQDYKCSVCPSIGKNIVRLIGLQFVMLVCLAILVKVTIQGAVKKMNYLSVYLRILMNHFQLLVIIQSFDLNWPLQLQNFFSGMLPISQVATQFISIDCFINNQLSATSGNFEQAMSRVFFVKIFILALSPLLVFFFSFLAWALVTFVIWQLRKISRSHSFSSSSTVAMSAEEKQINDLKLSGEMRRANKNRVLSTIIIILFLIHPTIISYMLQAFNCQSIDGTDRLYSDLEIVCYTEAHTFIAYTVALPALIVWGLGIPTVGLSLLYQRRDQFKLMAVKEQFGFLYNGYREPQAYYWEFVIIYRKVILIFIQVFLTQHGQIVQALVLLFFLLLNLAVTLTKEPYINHILNNLESISLFTSAFTVYGGLFFIQGSPNGSFIITTLNESSQLVLFSMIVICHLVFAIYWVLNFAKQFKATIRAKAPSIYLALFLCCKQQNLDTELKVEAYQDKIEPFLLSYDKILEYLNSRRHMYTHGNVPLEDEGLRSLLTSCYTFMSRAENMVKNSGSIDKKFVTIEELVSQKQVSQQKKHVKLRPQNTFSMTQNIQKLDLLASENHIRLDTEYMEEYKKGEKEHTMLKIDDELLTLDNEQSPRLNIKKSKNGTPSTMKHVNFFNFNKSKSDKRKPSQFERSSARSSSKLDDTTSNFLRKSNVTTLQMLQGFEEYHKKHEFSKFQKPARGSTQHEIKSKNEEELDILKDLQCIVERDFTTRMRNEELIRERQGSVLVQQAITSPTQRHVKRQKEKREKQKRLEESMIKGEISQRRKRQARKEDSQIKIHDDSLSISSDYN